MRLRTATLVIGVLVVLAAALLYPRLLPKRCPCGPSLPAQGTWEDCDVVRLAATCDARLAEMHRVGLRFAVVDPLRFQPAALKAYAATARRDGIGLIWYLADPKWFVGYRPAGRDLLADYPALTASCGCRTNAQLERALVGTLQRLPATQGYYLVDDSQLHSTTQTALEDWVASVRALDRDPDHLTMIAHWGIARDQAATFAQQAGIGSVDANEWYPVMRSWAEQAAPERAMASVTHAIARRHHQLTAFFLQAFSWGDSLADARSIGACSRRDSAASCAAKLPFPTAGQMVSIRNAAIEAGAPDMLIWYRWTALEGIPGESDPVAARIGRAGLERRLQAFAQAVRAPAPDYAASSR